MSSYRIDSDVELASDWLPSEAFSRVYGHQAVAVATAIEAAGDPEVDEVQVVRAGTGTVVWRSVGKNMRASEGLGWS